MSRLIKLAATATVMTFAISGCGSSSEGPDTGASASTSSPNSGNSPAPGNESESREGWKVAAVDSAQLQVPPDWTLTSSRKSSQTLRAAKDSAGISPGTGVFQDNVNAGNAGAEAVDELAKLREKTLTRDYQKVRRLPNETINGSVFYHFQSETDVYWQDHYGTIVPDGSKQVTVYWYFHKVGLDRKGAESLIAQIMPTYKVT